MALTVSLGKWAELSDTQQELLTKIGVKPKETILEKRKKAFLEEYKPYILAIYTDCNLCGAKFVQKFKMMPTFDNELPYLKGKPLKNPKLILEDQRENTRRPSCVFCKKRLTELTKEEIIDKLTKYAFYAAAFGGGK